MERGSRVWRPPALSGAGPLSGNVGADLAAGSRSGWVVSIDIPMLAGPAPVLSQVDRSGREGGGGVRIV
jgi:hypothetical protein